MQDLDAVRGGRQRGRLVNQNDGAQVRTVGQHIRQRRQTSAACHQNADVAVDHDVLRLAALQHRVQRHENAACMSRTKTGDHGLEPLVQIHRDALCPMQAASHQTAREALHRLGEIAVGQGLPVAAKRDRQRIAQRCRQNKIRQAVVHEQLPKREGMT